VNKLEALPARPQNARPFLNIPRIAAGADAARINQAARAVSQLASPSAILRRSISSPRRGASLEERLHNSRTACKIRTAAVAMHLDREWRTRFFAQVDSLLSCDDWDKDDLPISEESFTTLLRMLLVIRATARSRRQQRWPRDRDVDRRRRPTHIECLPGDEVHWIVFRAIEGGRESAAGETVLPRLLAVLQPYAPQHWFSDEGPKAPT
jgi:hypothetical protein